MSSPGGYEKLSLKQVLMRILSVAACGCGVAACTFSLSLQVQDVGNLSASLCWFSGLGTVVAAAAGYVVTCGPEFKNRVPLAVTLIFALGVAVFLLEREFLWLQTVIAAALVALAVEAVALVAYHQALKREDPLAR